MKPERVNTFQPVQEEWGRVWDTLSVEKELAGFAEQEKDYAEFLRLFDKYFPKQGRILEGGCGLGKWVITLGERGYDVYGVDYSRKAIKLLRRYDPRLKVQFGDVAKLPFADDFFDGYYSGGVVEHFEEGPERALVEAFRVLRPGGVLIIATPVQNTYRWISRPLRFLWLELYFFLWRVLSKRQRHFFEYRYTIGDMTQYLRSAGFAIVHVEPIMHAHGLYADFIFLRSCAEAFHVNRLGAAIARWSKRHAPLVFPHSAIFVARKPK